MELAIFASSLIWETLRASAFCRWPELFLGDSGKVAWWNVQVPQIKKRGYGWLSNYDIIQKPTLVWIDAHGNWLYIWSQMCAVMPQYCLQFKDTYLQKCGWHGALVVASVLIVLSVLSSLPSFNFDGSAWHVPCSDLSPWLGTDPSRLGGTSMVSYSIMTLLPQAFYYAPILLPFAIGNGMVAGRSWSCANLFHIEIF